MRIIIIADTHTNLEPAFKAIELIDNPDLIVHLGDCVIDARELHSKTGLPYKAIKGNNDWKAEEPYQDFWEFEGVRIMAIHGHHMDINRADPDTDRQKKFETIAKQAKKEDCKLVLYGHDHLAAKFYIDDVLFFNPGEMMYGAKRPSCGILNISNGEFDIEHYPIQPDAI